MKNKIISKCEKLFLELGFKNVTMDDIANAMGISKKTIYIHFSNKTELIEAVVFSVLVFFIKILNKLIKKPSTQLKSCMILKCLL